MGTNLNHVTLSGRLTRDPTLETLPSGHIVCAMQLACHYRARDNHTGEWREHTDFLPVRAFSHQARTSGDHLHKGDEIALAGRICSRKVYSPDAPPCWITEVIAQTVQFTRAR